MQYISEWQALFLKYQTALSQESVFQQGGVHAQATQLALGPYKLRCFAERLRNDHIAIWELPEPISWLDLLRVYLINKHHWNLETVRTMKSEEDFLFLLRDEVCQMKLTEEEAAPVRMSTKNWNYASVFALHFEEDYREGLPFP